MNAIVIEETLNIYRRGYSFREGKREKEFTGGDLGVLGRTW